MKINLIAARSRTGAIGLDGKMPWHLPQDLKHFKAVTLGYPIIMGRKTYQSIGRALPGRENHVVSRNPPERGGLGGEHPVWWHLSFEAARDAAARAGADQCFVIGGAQVYALALPAADAIFMTEIDADIEGDTHFPAFDEATFKPAVLGRVAANSDSPGMTFMKYSRIS